MTANGSAAEIADGVNGDPILPLKLFGPEVSYFTGKLESVMRFMELPYERITKGPMGELARATGVAQVPALQLADDRWLTDTTPIIAWLDARYPDAQVIPRDPVVAFFSRLLEDYADEWLWRPAMHYRWSYLQDRQYASGVLADELLTDRRIPRFAKRFLLTRRQLGGFVDGDGVRDSTRAHVEQGYLSALDRLETIFTQRRFLLGYQPTIADFGFMGPMLRHFGQDPTPQEIMRNRAPGVYAWVARMWNTRETGSAPALISKIDAPLSALLREACETHVVQLRENATAYGRGLKRYDQAIQGCQYEQVPSSRYRVWCLEELRREWVELDEAASETLREHLPEAEAAVLWDGSSVQSSEYYPERRAPFNRAINVFGKGVPPRS